MIKRINRVFKQKFGKATLRIKSPGRINLIGEHTDYNDGFVFPAAIEKAIYFAAAPNKIRKFRFYAYNLQEDFELDIDKLAITETAWANYLLGVYAQFKKAGYHLEGVDCVFGGDIPMGSGLSSSAAIENGFAMALNYLFDTKIDKIDLVKMAQKAEHEYAGVQCGIMDQFAGMYGKKGYALKLDTRSLDFDYAHIDLKDYNLVLCDTRVKHDLASSEYNVRRKECKTGVSILSQYNPDIRALRDVSIELLEQYKTEFDPVVYKRCTYVVKENKRVEQAFFALQSNNIQRFGDLMYQSHEGLRDEYEVSCSELDLLYDIARDSGDVAGARMMGGGFGGCTINIVKRDKLAAFSNNIRETYQKTTGIRPEITVVRIGEGTSII
ncbi:MAG: galactokinase [bacterium]|nr:MAG: galactokinase [bacterium]